MINILKHKQSIRNKKYYMTHKEKENKRCRAYYHNNLLQQRKRCRLHKRMNRNHYTAYMRNKRHTDLNFLLSSRLRRRLLSAFQLEGIKKNKKSSKYGINYSEIISHLNNTLPHDYNKHPKKYCLDHIIPLSYFDLSKAKEVKKAQSKENIQWLTVQENIQKRDKLNWRKQ